MRGHLFKRGLAVLGVTLTALGPSWGFRGEDPLNGQPWHHQEISEIGLEAAGITDKAVRETIGWHADYVDSYLYNPLWWAKGGLGRFRMALVMTDELEKVHFDDLFSSDQVQYMWRRYISGTVAGLLWARDNWARDKNSDHVAAAQNLLGVSLHAIQDFYSHSNWVDAKERRNRTYFQTSIADRTSLALYTGAYELEEHLGIKHHGAYSPAASIMMQPGISHLLDIASSGFSPLQNMPIMETYRKIKNNSESVEPYIPFLKENGIRVPSNIIYLAPPGIALDSTWMAEIGTRIRGIKDATPLEMFNTARGLAINQTTQWVRRIEWAMIKAGAGDFWEKVKTTSFSKEDREKQYEDYRKFAFTFLSAGPYPPPQTGNSEEYYLRLQIKTSSAAFSGTNSDIYLKVGDKKFMLDHMPRSMPILAYDDFESGDDTVYWAGPFTSVPTAITFHNDSAGVKETLKALGRVFAKAGEKIGDIALSIIAGNADVVGNNKKVWMPDDLAAITEAGKPWDVSINGGDQGHYQVFGSIRRDTINEARDTVTYKVSIDRMKCIKESKWDRGSNSDEPFLLALASSLPGGIQRFRTEPFKDVDKNEVRDINHVYTVELPRRYGVLNLPLCVMESDNESYNDRTKLLWEFGGWNEKEIEDSKRGFLASLDSARAADWKLDHLKVYMWSRNGTLRQGQVMDRRVNQWVDGGDSVTYNLHTPGLVQYPVTTDQLMMEEGITPGEPEPTNPNNPNNPNPNNPAPTTPTDAQLNDFLRLKGTWKTNKGTFLTVNDAPTLPSYNGPKLLYGKAITNPGGQIPDYKESAYFQLAPGFASIKGDFTAYVNGGNYQDYNSFGMVYITLSPDGNKFSGKVVLKSGNEYVYTGERVANTPENPNNPGNPNTPGVPAVGAIGSWVPLYSYSARVDKVQRGMVPQTLDVFVTYKNTTQREVGLTAGSVAFYLFDTEGIGVGNKGNLYSAEGDRPERIEYTIRLQSNGEMTVRYVVDVPTGFAPLYRMSLSESGTVLRLIDLTKLPPADGYVAPVPASNVTPAPNPKWMSMIEVDVRLDGLRKSADGQFYEGFFSIRNPSKKILGLDGYRISLTSDNGASVRTDGNLYRWSGERVERIQHSVRMLPGEITKVRYRFPIQRGMPAFTKLTLQEGNGPIQSAPLPTLP